MELSRACSIAVNHATIDGESQVADYEGGECPGKNQQAARGLPC
jgi:hypothetical protein